MRRHVCSALAMQTCSLIRFGLWFKKHSRELLAVVREREAPQTRVCHLDYEVQVLFRGECLGVQQLEEPPEKEFKTGTQTRSTLTKRGRPTWKTKKLGWFCEIASSFPFQHLAISCPVCSISSLNYVQLNIRWDVFFNRIIIHLSKK